MKRLTNCDIKNRELKILLVFHDFCMKYHLRYSLAGGTLLGAVRHKGFIPWDDDIDVCMPRPDYEKFIQNFKSEANNLEVRSFSLGNYSAPFTKIIDRNTVIYSKYNSSLEAASLWIDIFPVDGLPEDDAATTKIYKAVSTYRRIFMLCDARLGEGTTIFRKLSKYILKPLALMYGRERCAKKIEEISRRIPYDKSDYVGAITWGLYGLGEKMKKSEYESFVSMEFEHHFFSVYSCWDSYLKGLYGDYMQLPPVEKRKTHDMEAYLLE
jgi:lipopolysaccharide cholinephosphotransferase